MIPFKQKSNSISKNTAVLIILLCISDCCFSYLQDLRRTTDVSRRYGNIDQRQAITKGDSNLPSLQQEPVEVSPYIRDVRADSRQSRIDARDIRTDFREIRSELRGNRRENSCVRESTTSSYPISSNRRSAISRDLNNNVRYDESSLFVRNAARHRRETRNNPTGSRLNQNYSQENKQRQLNRITRESSKERIRVGDINDNSLRADNNIQENFRRQLSREERLLPSTQRSVRQRTTARFADHRSTPTLVAARESSRRFRDIRERSDTSRMATKYNLERQDRWSQKRQENRDASNELRGTRERVDDRTTPSRDQPKARDHSKDITVSRVAQQQYERREQRNSRDMTGIIRNPHTDRSTSQAYDPRYQRRTVDHLNYLRERQDIARVSRNPRFARHNLEPRGSEATQEWARTLRKSEPTNSRQLIADRRKRHETQPGQSRRVRNIREDSTNDNNRQFRFVSNERRENVQEQPKVHRLTSRQMRENSASDNNRLDRQSWQMDQRNTNQNLREYFHQVRERLADSSNSPQERRDASREQLENHREHSPSFQEQRRGVIRQKTLSSFDQKNENSRKNRNQAFENVRHGELEQKNKRNVQRNLMTAYEMRHFLNSNRRDTVRNKNQGRSIRTSLSRTDVRDSSTREVKLEALEKLEFIPNFTEKSNMLINTLQAVLVVVIFGQIFWSTSKNNFRFSNWQSVFRKDKLY